MADAAKNLTPNPEEQRDVENDYIRGMYGITPDIMEKLEKEYWEIRSIALNADRKNPSEYERAMGQLLIKIKETFNLNTKKMPYEVPDLAPGLPLKTAILIYPDFEKEFQKTPEQRQKEAAEMEKHLKEGRADYIKWVNEEETKLKEADKRFSPAPPRGKKVDDVVTSVKESLDELLTPEVQDEDIEYLDEDDQRKAS